MAIRHADCTRPANLPSKVRTAPAHCRSSAQSAPRNADWRTGLSESLSRELASFNIRVLLVEPGAFRTNFLGAFQSPAAGLTKDYEGTVLDDMLKTFHAANGKQPGDPVKAADRIIEVISGTGMGAGKTHLLRLPLGPDCMNRARAKVESLSKNLDEMEAIALSTDLEKP